MNPGRLGRQSSVQDPAETMVVLLQGGVELARWPLGQLTSPELAVADGLARLQLAVRAFGWSIRLERAPVEMVDLLDLCGLREVVPVNLLRIEPWRQPEVGEQVEIEDDVREAGDSDRELLAAPSAPRKRVAARGIAALEATPEPLHALLGGAVRERLRLDAAAHPLLDAVVADRRRGVERVLEIARL